MRSSILLTGKKTPEPGELFVYEEKSFSKVPSKDIENYRRRLKLDETSLSTETERPNMHNVLSELDTLSLKYPEILVNLLGEISPFITLSQDDHKGAYPLRRLAYTLLLRYMHYSPRYGFIFTR